MGVWSSKLREVDTRPAFANANATPTETTALAVDEHAPRPAYAGYYGPTESETPATKGGLFERLRPRFSQKSVSVDAVPLGTGASAAAAAATPVTPYAVEPSAPTEEASPPDYDIDFPRHSIVIRRGATLPVDQKIVAYIESDAGNYEVDALGGGNMDRFNYDLRRTLDHCAQQVAVDKGNPTYELKVRVEKLGLIFPLDRHDFSMRISIHWIVEFRSMSPELVKALGMKTVPTESFVLVMASPAEEGTNGFTLMIFQDGARWIHNAALRLLTPKEEI